MSRPVIVFDSGMGGLTVLAALRRARPDLDILYVADDAGFPYGAKSDGDLIERVVSIAGGLIAEHAPAGLVIACNSASTLVLGPLRQRFAVPVVGTVPAIKPAAAATRSRLVSVLGTPGTVARDYTRALIEEFAAGVHVNLVGASHLAAIAEATICGDAADPEAVAREIAPAFVSRDGERTDIVVLACTHYPLLLPVLEAAAPWPVEWLDPAPAIARRASEVVGPAQGAGQGVGEGACRFIATSGADISAPAARALAALIDRNDRPI